MGFIGYEFIHDIEPVVPRPPHDELNTPVMYFLIADELLIFDRVAQTITILVNAIIENGANPADAYEDALGEIERLVTLLEQPTMHSPVMVPAEVPAIHFDSNLTREKFTANVVKAKEYITCGDIIQVVGSQRFSTPVKASPMDIYRAVRSINPSPYMFLLELEGMSLVGASPELHVRCEDRQVEIRPIAGTRPRGKTPEEDLQRWKRTCSPTPRSARNTSCWWTWRATTSAAFAISAACRCKDLMIIERYSHVMHIVSQVEGPARRGQDALRFDARDLSRPAR